MKTAETTTQAEELRAGRTIIVNTVGRSMQPLLYENDTQVVVAPIRRPLKKGDLVLYENMIGSPVIHRIIRLSENTAMIRGDNELVTETVPLEKIAGVAADIFRHGKHFQADGWIMRTYGFWMIGIFPLRKSFKALLHYGASILPSPAVDTARALIRKMRK